jgi:hypothetical protein
MNAVTRRKLSMATRVLDFEQAHIATDVGHVALVARFEALVTKADALALRQRGGTLSERAATNRRLQFRDAITRQLRHLVQVAEVAAKGEPALAGHFVAAPRQAPHRTFLTAAKTLLAAATTHEALLVPQGLGERFVAELGTGVTTFEALSETIHAGRRDHVGARAELQAVSEEIGEVVRLLDGLNRARFDGQPELLAAWESARNVEGPFRAPREEAETPAAPTDIAA